MTHIDTVSSRTNPTVRLVHSLREHRAARRRERLFVAEGLRAVGALIGHGCRLERMLVDAERLDEVPQALIAAADAADTRLLAVASDIFADLSDVESAQPVIGVFAMTEHAVPSSPDVVLVLDGIQDPGNLGSILRTCRAARADAVLLARGTVDPYSPKVVRATAGEFAPLALFPVASPTALRTGSFSGFPDRILIADSRDGVRHTEIDWMRPFTLVLGNEAAGPSEAWATAASERVRIAMDSKIESLNVAAAAAVLLFEARRTYAFE